MNVVILKDKLDSLAGAIAAKAGVALPLTLAQMKSAVDGITTGGEPFLQAKTRTITAAGTFTDTPDDGYDGLSSVETTVPQGEIFVGSPDVNGEFYTQNNQRMWRTRSSGGIVTGDDYGTPGFIADNTWDYSGYNSWNAVAANTSITPTESSQTIGGTRYMMEGAVTVNAISSSYVGSGITRRSGSDMTASNLSVTAPAGYYASAGTKTLSDQNLVAENVKKDVTIFGVTGSYEGGGTPELHVDTKDVTPSSASGSIQFTGLAGEPTSFSVVCRSDLSTGSPYKVAAVAFDGSSTIGQYITNTSNAQMTYDGSAFSHSYSNGTLTVTCSGANFQAAEYILCYTYGGGTIASEQVQVGSGATSITFTGISDEPEAWTCIFTSDIGTSSGYTRAHVVAYDGSSIYGMEMGSGSQATAHWSASFSNGSLTISSQSTSQGGYFHQPGYYELVYAIGGGNYQSKTVTPTTSAQTVTADSGYDALKRVTVNAIPSEYIIPTGNIAITSNTGTGQSLDISQYATATVSVPTGGGSASTDTKTVTASNRPSTLSFTGMKGQPIAWALRATFTMTSSSSTYYYVDSMRGIGTSNVQGRLFRMGSTRQTEAVTTGYSASYSGTTFTVTSSGNRTTSPGCFYNGSYELVYVY